MSFKEIVTLQVGHYANYIGAHWWNLQESSFVYDPSKATGPKEICHDVLFREGLTLQNQVTFTPRLVAFDLKGSLLSLKQDGGLYETGLEGEGIRWPGDITMHEVSVLELSRFYYIFQGSLRSLKQDGGLYETGLEGEGICWPGDVTMHEEEPAPRNSFLDSLDWDNTDEESREQDKEEEDEKPEEIEGLPKKRRAEEPAHSEPFEASERKLYNLDDTVTVWSDFLRTHFHPKSIHLVQDYHHGDDYRSFDLFSCAGEVLSSYERTCEWEDRLHHFTEECDSLQGFHVLADTHDGFGGLSEGLVRHLADEYPGKGILTFGFTASHLPDDTAKARATRIINSALAYSKISDHSSLFVPACLSRGVWPKFEAPVSLPDLSYQCMPYHTSAILAASLDTLSLPYRLETGPMNIRDITHSFNSQGRTVAALNTSMPLGLQHNESIVDFFSRNGDSFPWQPLTPHMKNTNIPIMQSVVMRGISDELVKTQTDMRKLPDHMRGLKTRKEVLESYLSHKCSGTLYAVNCLESPIKTTIPFPHIFKESVNRYGYQCGVSRPTDMGVESIPQMTSLQCNTEVGGVIKRLHTAAAKMNIKKHHRYLEQGLEEEEYTDVLDDLETLSGKYYTESEGL